MRNVRSLFSLGSRQLRHRKGRSLLTSIGITLGVAILFGVLVSNATTNEGFRKLIEDFTGRADVLITPSGSGDAVVSADVVEKIEGLDRVKTAVGSYGLRGGVEVPGDDEPERVSVRGITFEQERLIHNFRLLRGSLFRSETNEAIVPDKLARKLKRGVGDDIRVSTPSGFVEFRLTGILRDEGAARTNEGNIIFTSLPTVWNITNKEHVIRTVSVILGPGTSTGPWIEQHEDDLGGGFDFEDSKDLAQGFFDFLRGIQSAFTTFAAIALFIGAFLIYLTLTTAVIERTRVFGTIRALGATKAQVRRIVILEALLLGIISSLLGLVLGSGIALGLLSLISKLFEVELDGLTIQPISVAIAVGVGVVVTLLASLIPARRAARVSPVDAIRGDVAQQTKLSKSWLLGLVLVAMGTFGSSTQGSVEQALGTLGILLGSVLIAPLLLRPLASILGVVIRKMSRGGGDIAVLHLVKERSRSAYTLALIMVVMAMIFANGGVEASLSKGIDSVLDKIYGADLVVEGRGVRFDPAVEAEIAGITGVGSVTALRDASTFLTREPGGKPIQTLVFVVDPRTYFEVEGFDLREGSEASVKAALGEGALLISDGLSGSSGKGVGDTIELRTLQGEKSFDVAGVFRSLLGPDVVAGDSLGRDYFGAINPTEFHLNTERGSTIASVRKEIKAVLGERYLLEFRTAADLKQEATDQLSQFTRIFLAILLVAAIIGLLGLANTLAMSVAQRTRETGVLRAIGFEKGQVRRMVLVESITLGLVAFALSVPLGWLLSRSAVSNISDGLGFALNYVYPARWVPIVAAFGMMVAILAALIPARRAARVQIVEALRFE